MPSSAGVLGVLGVCGELPFESTGFDFGIVTEAIAAFAFFAALGMAGVQRGNDEWKEREGRGHASGGATRYIDVLDERTSSEDELRPTRAREDPISCT